MNRKALKTCVGVLANALGLLLGAAGARAQMTPPPNPGDWGALGSYVNRQNRNGDPEKFNPGRNDLRWTAPNTVPERAVLTLDNTDFANRFFTNYGVGTATDPGIDNPLYDAGEVALLAGPTPYTWRGPASVENEASAPYTLAYRSRYANNAQGTPNGYVQNLRVRAPSYLFTECTPSAQGQSDPTVAQNAGDLRYFEWTFRPPAGPDRNYAIYAYLPLGPTTEGTARLFSQRYYVYKIFYGNGQSYTDVVDTYSAGSGFVRLGNGGFATNRVFPFLNADSTNPANAYPIRVRLYNTVPRNSSGQLLIDGSVPSMTIQSERTLARSRIVYADAARLTPQIGSYAANAVTQTFTPSTTNPVSSDGEDTAGGIDARVTVALNEFQTSTVSNALQQSTAGTVISYQSNPTRWPITDPTTTPPSRQTPVEVWRYSLAQESANATNVDNPDAATAAGGWTAETTVPHVGPNYLTKPIVVDTPNPDPLLPGTPPTAIATATYAPALDDGDYSIYAYIGGQRAGTFGKSVRFYIYQGAAVVDTVLVDLDAPQTTRLGPGWVRVGLRRYRNVRDDNDLTNAVPLRVVVTNYSSLQADAGKKAFADAIRFVGDENSAITSTPVHATVKIGPGGVETKVVVVADESGKIHCLDATGNADGTTWEYWSYPSTRTGTGYQDPNLVEGIDGKYDATLGDDNVPTAVMPTGFDLSSALVARVQTGATTTADYLYVGATNGRVYCIDMAGRGDYDKTTRKIGTTKRIWTYPDDYPSPNPQTSDLGAFRGSIVFGNADTGAGTVQTVYVPAYQGRIYALNALPDAGNNRTTTVRWRYPEATLAPLPNIVMTPTLFRLTTGPNAGKGRLYFGTAQSTADDGQGRLYCLDAESGDIVWQYNGNAVRDPLDLHDTPATVRYNAANVFSAGNGYQNDGTLPIDRTVDRFSAFVAGMVAVPKNLLDLHPASVGTPLVHVDELYALNNNRFLYAFNADTGLPIVGGGHNYATNDLDVLSDANLTFTFTQAYNRSSAIVGTGPNAPVNGLELFPTIIVPSNDGRMREAFARVEDFNAFDGYVADGVNFPASLNGAAASNNSTYLTDTMGSLYALDDKGGTAGNLLSNFDYGVNRVVPPNDPYGAIYRNLKIRLVNRAAYNALRTVNEDGEGLLNYYQVNDPANADFPKYQGPATSLGNPYAFEWGETAYVMVYDFPYSTIGQDGARVPAPTITLTLSVDGKTVRQQQIDTRKYFHEPPAPAVDGNPTYNDPPNNTPMLKDGYAVYPFTFNSAGSTALPPGSGKITATISTSAVGGGQGAAEILNDTRPNSATANGSAINFQMANPLAVQMVERPGEAPTSAIGNTIVANSPQNLVNGSPNMVNGATTSYYSQLLASAGFANHGGAGTARFNVYDRSLMALVRPEGLNNVRLQRSNLERQGGPTSVLRPLVSSLYPNFEDSEATAFRPNRSLDYPNIGREQVRATKDPNGNAENPLLSAVTLRPPVSLTNTPVTEATLERDSQSGVHNNRQLVPTPFELTIDVPRYQPPVNTSAMNDAGSPDNPTDLLNIRHAFSGRGKEIPQGYFGRVQVFVDSNNDQARNDTTNAEAFRSFNYSLGVQPQVAILTGTPNVDLGSLAAGTGYDTANPAAALGKGNRGNFNPWVGQWNDAYRSISVRNDGNVNLLDLRMAKARNFSGTNEAWGIYSDDSDPMAWLSAALFGGGRQLQPGSLWSNIDTTFAPRNDYDPQTDKRNFVILQKPRVTDRTPTELIVNAYPRPNPNLPPTITAANTVGLNPLRINRESGIDQKNPAPPNVGISVPLGFPVGNYSAEIRVVENVGGDDQILSLINNEYEPYSDPITVSFKVRETRMTNRATPKTAPVIDNPFGFEDYDNPYDPNLGVANNDPLKRKPLFRNAAPAGLRLGTGGLVVAWESDRLARRLANANGAPLAENPSLIYLASLGVTSEVRPNNAQLGAPAGNSPLWDLTQFSPTSDAQWFAPGNGGVGYPANPGSLFPEGTAIAGTMRFGSPTFPQSLNTPLGSFNAPLMGFVGDAQVGTSTGRLALSRVFVTPVAVGASGVTLGTPTAVPADPQTAKGKPSVLQFANDAALVFYSETSAGQSGISVSRMANGGFPAPPVALSFGDGFSSVFSPSASARRLNGNGPLMAELSFAGKLRGRPNAEVYLGRMNLSAAGTLVDGAGTNVETPRSGSPFRTLPQQVLERLVNEGSGVYRARGVAWSRQSGVALVQSLNGVATPLFVGPASVERQSGLIAYNSALGGKVYLDPELGTVKFVGGVPARGAELRLTYTPTFLRVTPGGTAGYNAVNGMWDGRSVSDYAYWYRADGTAANGSETNLRNDRYFFAYGRGAAGGGLTARPYSTSLRLGVRLPTRIATRDDGSVVRVNVTGNTMPYQVDPANGRIYFMAEDENRAVTIRYTGVSEATNGQVDFNTLPATNVSFVLEKTEAPIPVDEAVNDSDVAAFLDPFAWPGRPPLVWLFYTSTRAGRPDVYFQTIAPRFQPFAK